MDSNADVIVGNVYNKYESKNPIARLLMNGFLKSVIGFCKEVQPRKILEVGCGEGRLAQRILQEVNRPEEFTASDISLERVESGLDPLISFVEASAYELPFSDNEYDLVICCEVLEHLETPDKALAELARVSSNRVLISTPREPLWRILNVCRGKYLRDWGNTPGHVQHFSRRGLIKLIGFYLKVKAVRSPIPWTVVMAEVESPSQSPTHSN